jgi:hypothetical protein
MASSSSNLIDELEEAFQVSETTPKISFENFCLVWAIEKKKIDRS